MKAKIEEIVREKQEIVNAYKTQEKQFAKCVEALEKSVRLAPCNKIFSVAVLY
jgi:hypothetical protein